MKKTICLFVVVTLFSSISSSVLEAQSGLKKFIDKINVNVNMPNTKILGKGATSNSAIKSSDFVQNQTIPRLNPNDTRFTIAPNLAFDVKGKYPTGYSPKWKFLSYRSDLDFQIDNYVNKYAVFKDQKFGIGFGEYQGKAVMRFGAFVTCDCLADIIIKDSLAVINGTPQTFKVTNFRKIGDQGTTGEPCRGLDNTIGGWEGKVTFATNENGDFTMDLVIESHSVPNTFGQTTVMYRYNAKGITFLNEMTVDKANATIAEEKAAKERYKNFLVSSKRQVDSLNKLIKTKYPGFNCRSCYFRSSDYGVTPTTTRNEWSNGDVTYDHDLSVTNKFIMANKCNQELTFIGIQQLYSDEKGYYYVDVTKKMEAKYYYEENLGLLSSIFTSVTGLDGDIRLQLEYDISNAHLNSIQWFKVIGSKKPPVPASH